MTSNEVMQLVGLRADVEASRSDLSNERLICDHDPPYRKIVAGTVGN
jgi:hypothetical protein